MMRTLVLAVAGGACVLLLIACVLLLIHEPHSVLLVMTKDYHPPTPTPHPGATNVTKS